MHWIKKNALLLLALIIAVFAGRMLLTTKHFYTHDDIQVFRVSEFVGCLQNGQIPCRWADNLGKGYGYPWFNYYPPMIYIVPSLLHLVGFSIVTSLNLFMFATFLLAAWSMFALVKELTKREDLAFLGSILFTLYPFHASNVFVRGVYAENLAWSIAPLLLLCIYKQVKNRFVYALPFVFAFIFLTHIISSFVLTGLALFWVLTLALVHKKNVLVTLLPLLGQIILGVCLAAFFFVPALMEKGLVQSDSLTQGYFAYTNHYVSSFQLFKEYKWNYEGSMWSAAPDEMPFMVGHVHLIVLLIAFISTLVLRIRTHLVLPSGMLVATAGFLFLAHFKSDPIWTLLPPLAYVQFPWRFIVWAGIPLILSITLFVSSLPHKFAYILTVLATVALLFYSYPFFFPKSYDAYSDADLLTGSQMADQQTKSLYDYLPITVHQVPEEYGHDSPAPIPVFYFPGWTATIEGEPVAITADPTYGLITPVDPVVDPKTIVLAWQETPLRLAMDILSMVTLLGYGFYAWKSHVQ